MKALPDGTLVGLAAALFSSRIPEGGHGPGGFVLHVADGDGEQKQVLLARALVLAAGYFDAARTRFNLKVGDMIECAAAVKGTPASALLQVASIAGTAVTMAVAAGGATLGLSATRFLKGTASGATIAAVTAQPGWIVSVLANNGVSVSLDPDNRTVKAAAAFGAVTTGSVKFRAVSADGRDAVERTFDLSVYDDAVSPPVTPPSANRVEAIRVGMYGDSYGQWTQVFTGSPNSADTAMVDPQGKKMPTDLTSPVGGNIDGYLSMLNVLSGGKYVAAYQSNFAVGGLVTGQLRRMDGDAVSDGRWLSWAKEQFAAQIAAGVGPDVILLPVGTNDASTTASVNESFANVVKIVGELLALSPTMKVVWEGFGPKGGSEFPDQRFTPEMAATHKARHDKLHADLIAQFPPGRVAVVNGWDDFVDAGTGVAGDIKPGMTLDGLHRAPPFGQIQVPKTIAALDSLFPNVVVGNFRGAGNLLPAGAGAGGSVTRGGGAALTTNFNVSGQCWTDWALSGGQNWIGTNGNNVTGTLTASVDAQGRQVIEVDGNASGKTSKAPVAILFKRTVPVAALASLSANDLVEMASRVQISGMVAFRGLDMELRVTEPDGTARVLHTLRSGQIVSDRKNLEWVPTDYVDGRALVPRSTFRRIKSGSYGTVDVALVFHFAGQAPSVKARVVVDPDVTLRRIAA